MVSIGTGQGAMAKHKLDSLQGRDFVQKSFYPIYALLGLCFLLIVIGFAVALSKVATVSAELQQMRANRTKDPFNHDLKLFPCGPDNRQWEYFGGKCYYFSLQAIGWHEARSQCERKHSQLVVIDNLAEQNFLQMRTRNERFWIGLHDQRTEGDWKWLDGKNYLTGFKNWRQGEPNDYGQKEDCGQLWISGEWNDFSCTSPSFFVCEKSLPGKAASAGRRS
uniref:C-type lectin domain-containing protein n=1 Tax=Salvator merianae TaxID=96440 RepID=A0A8D0E0H2_SALMN